MIADDGPQWFRLRSLMFRGVARSVGDQSYEITPTRMVAWDYGALRESPKPLADPAPPPEFTPLDAVPDLNVPNYPTNLAAAVRKSRVMIMSSRSAAGTPFAVPLWFVTHCGRIYATTSAASWTVRNVLARPQVALLFGGERSSHSTRRLIVRGHATAVQGMPPPAVAAQIAWRYYLQPSYAAVELRHISNWKRRFHYYGQSQPAHLVITPQSVTACEAP
ncbi:pyridoxamine 5'-phosphate oxidase family protein [Mycolicibacterium rhodesiae]|uniref:pyridoxamine 5'-phosphate oxidase family protein n=1 Tax=Mycolicibacterium rhodesiae TaxID=36814 RepID=UPI0013FE1E63|nr:pyridoxamine 5'-phosphate oxidase family protein [Mycolicibacterium rhodesiae]MCV7345528.1 pyridoxamine 5'-phosphate oxidase family protein [Mycolicibacterium rhodesiae]